MSKTCIVRQASQVTVLIVKPTIVAGRKRISFTAGLLFNTGTTMTTRVEKRINNAITITSNQQRYAGIIGS